MRTIGRLGGAGDGMRQEERSQGVDEPVRLGPAPGADILSPSGYHIYNHCVSMNALKCDSFLVPRSRCSQMPIELERNLQVSTPAELLAGWRVASRLGYSLSPCCGSTREPAPTGFRHQTATTTIPRETR